MVPPPLSIPPPFSVPPPLVSRLVAAGSGSGSTQRKSKCRSDSSMSLRLARLTSFTTRTAASGVRCAADAARPSADASHLNACWSQTVNPPHLNHPSASVASLATTSWKSFNAASNVRPTYRLISRGVFARPHATASSITRRMPSFAILELNASPVETSRLPSSLATASRSFGRTPSAGRIADQSISFGPGASTYASPRDANPARPARPTIC